MKEAKPVHPPMGTPGALLPQRRRERKGGRVPVLGALLLVVVLATPGPLLAAPPIGVAPPPPPAPAALLRGQGQEDERLVARSGTFALTFPNQEWFAVDPDERPDLAGLDIAVYRAGGGGWVKGRLARRSNRGVEGALIDEASHAKYLIEYEPDTVRTELSLETYRGSALYCGRLRHGSAREACSLVAVRLHGRQMIRLHSLVDAKTPRMRKAILAEIESAFASLETIPPASVKSRPESSPENPRAGSR